MKPLHRLCISNRGSHAFHDTPTGDIMLQNILRAITDVPAYVNELLHGSHAAAAVIAGIVFLIVLLITNKFTRVLRELFVVAAIVLGVIAYFRRNYPLLWVCVFVIVILGVFRFIRYLLVTVRTNRRNRKIEEQALEKARKRRGSFRSNSTDASRNRLKDNEGYDLEFSTEESTKEGFSRSESRISSEGLSSENEFTDGASPQPDIASPISRKEILDAIDMLHRLRDIGVLTEEECNTKAAKLYELLG